MGHLFAIQAVSQTTPVWLQEVLNSYHTDPEAQRLLQTLALHSPNDQGYSLDKGLIRYKGHVWLANNQH